MIDLDGLLKIVATPVALALLLLAIGASLIRHLRECAENSKAVSTALASMNATLKTNTEILERVEERGNNTAELAAKSATRIARLEGAHDAESGK